MIDVKGFHSEVAQGESVLHVAEDGQMERHLQVAIVHIYCSGKKLYHVAKTGASTGKRCKNRGGKLLSEKIKIGETAMEAAQRGVVEELGDAIRIREWLGEGPATVEWRDYCKFGRLRTRYTLYPICANAEIQDLGTMTTQEGDWTHEWMWA
jgi:hypothetical protein